jgi:heat shock protein HslJ
VHPPSAGIRPVVIAILLAVALAVAGCGGEPDPSGSPPAGALTTLAGSSWAVVSVNGRPPIPGHVPTVAFEAERISGSGGCNQFGGQYQADPTTGQFATRELGSTLIGCVAAGVSDFESAFLQVLGGATQVAFDPAGQLVLSGPIGRVVLVKLEHPAVEG